MSVCHHHGSNFSRVNMRKAKLFVPLSLVFVSVLIFLLCRILSLILLRLSLLACLNHQKTSFSSANNYLEFVKSLLKIKTSTGNILRLVCSKYGVSFIASLSNFDAFALCSLTKIKTTNKPSGIEVYAQYILHPGLRTLCIAMTELEPEDFQRWSDIYYKASTSLENREKNVDDAAELIEKVTLFVASFY